MNNRTLELFRLCQKAKEYGCDAFFSYSSHVNGYTVSVYKSGWYEKRYENGEYMLDEEGETIAVESDFYSYFYGDEIEKMDEAILYLTNSIKEKSPQELAFQESK